MKKVSIFGGLVLVCLVFAGRLLPVEQKVESPPKNAAATLNASVVRPNSATAVALQASQPQLIEKPLERYEKSSDLFGFFKRATSLSSGAALVQALEAARTCDFFIGNFERLGNIAGGGKTDPPSSDAVSQGQRDAIAEFQRRCSGFERMSSVERRAVIQQASARAASAGAPEVKYFGHRSTQDIAPQDLRVMLGSVSGVNKDLLLVPVSLLAAESLPATPRRTDLSSMAAYLALCDLSGACAADSLYTLIACSEGSMCSGLDADWDAPYSEEDRSAIQALRVSLVESIRNKTFLHKIR